MMSGCRVMAQVNRQAILDQILPLNLLTGVTIKISKKDKNAKRYYDFTPAYQKI